MKHLNITKNTISYKFTDAGKLTPAIIKKTRWPRDIKFLCFEPGSGFMRMEKPVKLGVPWHKFSGGVIFMQNSDALPENHVSGKGQVRVETIKSKKMLCSLYTSTQDSYYKVAWKNWLGRHMIEESKTFNKESLPYLTGAVALKGKKPVGMVAGDKHKVKFINKFVWFITWIWIDPELRGAARAEVKAKFVEWLKRRPVKNICAHVNTFNIPSQKFFLNLGFRPIRVLFYERDGIDKAGTK